MPSSIPDLATSSAAEPAVRTHGLTKRFGKLVAVDHLDLTVLENLTFYSRVYMVSRATRARRIAQMLRLADLGGRERQLAGHLSGGYRQRLALACAFVHEPRLIFLDEPTAGVDP